MRKRNGLVLGVGNVYVETNFLGLETSAKDYLEIGKEYASTSYEIRLGGSAINFVSQLRNLGMDVGIIGKTGMDEPAFKLFDLLKKKNIRTDLIKRSEKVKTNIDSGLVLRHNGQNIQIVAGNANQSLDIDDLDLENPLFNEVKAIYFGGSFKQQLLWPHYPELFKKIHSMGIKLFLDPGRVPVSSDSHLIDILKKVLPFTDIYLPNELEIQSVTDEKEIDNALEKVISWGAKNIVVKLGEKGCVSFSGRRKYISKGFKVKPVSTVGAGDVFNAAFVFEFLKGSDIKTCSLFANAAAAIRVSKNYQPNENEVLAYINKGRR